MQTSRTDTVERARVGIGIALACVLAFGILTLWVKALWATAVVQVGILLLAAIWLAGTLVFRFPVRMHALMVPLGGAVIWGCIQLATERTIYQHATFSATLDWLIRLAAFWLALQAFSDDRFRKQILNAALWFGFVISILAIILRLPPMQDVSIPFDPGEMWPFPNRNQFAAFMEILFPLAIVQTLLGSGHRLIYPVMAATLFAAVGHSGSRSGTALLLALAVVILVVLRARVWIPRRRLLLAAGSLVLFGVIFVQAVGWEYLWSRLADPRSWNQRIDLNAATVEMVRERPLTGFGLKTWSTAYPAYARFDDGLFDNQAHNDWLQWASEGGVPFLLLMLWWAALLVGPARRTVWGVGLLAVLAHCLLEYHFQQRLAFGYFFFAVAGILVSDTGDSIRER